jgi:hypothetical protein
MRDRFLVLAADAALAAGQDQEAERLRGHLLEKNPHHLLRPFASLREALGSADVESYLRELRSNYPPGVARRFLESARASQGQDLGKLDATLPAHELARYWSEPQQLDERTAESLKVYRWREEPGNRDQPAPSRPGVRTPAGPSPESRPKGQAAIQTKFTMPCPSEMLPEHSFSSEAGQRVLPEEGEDGVRGGWVSLLLFLLLLAAGLVFLVQAVVGPFGPGKG